MERAAAEISHWAEYDYVLINNDAEKCRELVHNILKAERLKATRRVFLHDFVRQLIGLTLRPLRLGVGSAGRKRGRT